ncbi:FAD/NAD(P)-binding protein [Streptomyces sp. NPDC008125]|uniref:FAD/NAD(P)-binding protein n=1 Tax=Streptomyces sp. NPDC008125 TaxID=3364811 RepID=UPI0036E7F2A8
MSTPPGIGIIGGGASAVCLLDSLSRGPRAPEAVTVFDPSPHLWRGRAYQPDSSALRVNAPPEDMTVRADGPEHFIGWLSARQAVLGDTTDHTDPLSGIPFPPRSLYGDYLEQSARGALGRLASRGCRIRLVREAVTDLVPDGGTLTAVTSTGDRYALAHAVLCVGTGVPADPHGLAGAPGFVADPYPVARRLDGIGAQDRVVVVGSGLTAVDVVLSLAAGGHQGSVVLASRRGVLPSVRQQPLEHALRHFTAERFRSMAARGETCTLGQAVALMEAELTDAGSSMAAVDREISAVAAEKPLDRLRRQLGSVRDRDPGLRILQRAVPDTGPDIWTLLPEADRVAVLRRHYRTIMSLCCPMPPSSAEILLGRAEKGLLEFSGGLERITARPGGGFDVCATGGTRRADVVVNAVNPPAHRVPPAADPLVSSLIRRGLATAHPRGGLHVDRATSGLVTDGVPSRRIHALGDLAAGSLFFTFGVPSLVDRAVDIAGAVLRQEDPAAGRRTGSVPAV